MANVLIVDDDTDAIEICKVLLTSAGHTVQTSHNGAEGLHALCRRPLPDCVLLDVDMPVLNGPGMAEQMIRHDNGEEKIPILLVSARNDLPAVAARIGTPYFLRKASHDYWKVLLGVLARALSERRVPTPA